MKAVTEAPGSAHSTRRHAEVVEAYCQITGFSFVGIAVQQHDWGIAGLPQEVRADTADWPCADQRPVAKSDVETRGGLPGRNA